MCLSKDEKKEQGKQRYHWLKEHHICVSCGCENAVKNHIYCIECLGKDREKSYKRFLNRSEEEKQKK